MRILVVDDHGPTRDLLSRNLEQRGNQVVAVGSCQEAQDAVADSKFQLIVLDVMLPDGSGVDLCRRMREDGQTVPILLLTARGEVGDRVKGLDAGADDYLAKPFAVSELMARVRALSRRETTREAKLQVGDLTIDLQARRVFLQESPVAMTAKELAVLEVLATRRGRIVSKEDLMESVWGEVSSSTEASLEVAIHRLRRKLGEASNLIQTVRGVGYLLETAT